MLRLVLLLALLVPALGSPIRREAAAPVAAAGPQCVNSGPSSNAYSVRVCIQTAGGTVLSGNATVTTTITPNFGTLPAVRQIVARMARGSSTSFPSVLTDYASPWSFTLPTPRWVDGAYRLRADVLFADGFAPARPILGVTLSNGVTVAPRSNGSWNPTSGLAGSPFEIAVVGDG